MKIDLEEVEAKMLELNIDPIKVNQVVSELEKVVEEIKEENAAEKGPKLKWEHAIVLLDKDGSLAGKELVGWVVQQKDGEDMNLIFSKLADAAKNQNEAAKRKKNFITTTTDLFQNLKPKFLKEKQLRIKTKELTRVLITGEKLV